LCSGCTKAARVPELPLEVVRVAGRCEGADSVCFAQPTACAVDARGNVYVLDSKACNVTVMDSTGRFLLSFGGQGDGPGEFSVPSDIAVSDSGLVFVSSLVPKRISIFRGDGEFARSFLTPGNPNRLDVSSRGEIYVTWFGLPADSLVTSYDIYGDVRRQFGTAPPSGYSYGNACDIFVVAGDRVYVSFREHPVLQVYGASGRLLLHREYSNDHIERMKERKKRARARRVASFESYFPRCCVLGDGTILLNAYGDRFWRVTPSGDLLQKLHVMEDGARVKLGAPAVSPKGTIWAINWDEALLYELAIPPVG
jgi:hypothetical protein